MTDVRQVARTDHASASDVVPDVAEPEPPQGPETDESDEIPDYHTSDDAGCESARPESRRCRRRFDRLEPAIDSIRLGTPATVCIDVAPTENREHRGSLDTGAGRAGKVAGRFFQEVTFLLQPLVLPTQPCQFIRIHGLLLALTVLPNPPRKQTLGDPQLLAYLSLGQLRMQHQGNSLLLEFRIEGSSFGHGRILPPDRSLCKRTVSENATNSWDLRNFVSSISIAWSLRLVHLDRSRREVPHFMFRIANIALKRTFKQF